MSANLIYSINIVLLCLCLTQQIVAQFGEVDQDDFYTSGQAVLSDNSCFAITSDINWMRGGVWHKYPMDPSQSFEISLDILMGCKDADGADGVVFIFSPYRNITGRPGEGMGFAGLYPSLGIEIDTWQNFHLADPYEDHVAILRDGFVDHFSNVIGPNPIPNVEDCKLHALEIIWNHQEATLTVRLDGKQVISYKGNLMEDIFTDQNEIYWGLTAATGKYNNKHALCFKKVSFTPALSGRRFSPKLLSEMEAGKMTAIENLSFQSGKTKVAKGSIEELYKLLNLLQANPNKALAIYGHTDNVGNSELNERVSAMRAQSVADFLIKNGIDPNRIVVQGLGEEYPRRTNKTEEGRGLNRRIEIKLYDPRT